MNQYRTEMENAFIVIFGPEVGPVEYRKYLRMMGDHRHGENKKLDKAEKKAMRTSLKERSEELEKV